MKSSVQNEDLKSELQDLIDQTKQAKETHRMEIVNDIYKKLHDLDYFLLRYGPIDVAKNILGYFFNYVDLPVQVKLN